MREKIEHINLVYFSPTGTSRKIAQSVCDGLNIGSVTEIDLTFKSSTITVLPQNSVTIFVSPVYGGRLPETFLHRLDRIKGNNTPCIIIVVYGNRDYEDALLELKDEVIKRDFIPVSGAAFIGEHSYSTKEMPIAAGRPDMCDLSLAELFGKESSDKLHITTDWSDLKVPGNFPYKERKSQQQVAPLTTNECTSCGTCDSLCPTSAIYVHNEGNVKTELSKCIKCCACVKGCPSDARIFNTPFAKFLYDNFKERKLPEFYY